MAFLWPAHLRLGSVSSAFSASAGVDVFSLPPWLSSCRAQDVGVLGETRSLFPAVPALSTGVWDHTQSLLQSSPSGSLVDLTQILSR